MQIILTQTNLIPVIINCPFDWMEQGCTFHLYNGTLLDVFYSDDELSIYVDNVLAITVQTLNNKHVVLEDNRAEVLHWSSLSIKVEENIINIY